VRTAVTAIIHALNTMLQTSVNAGSTIDGHFGHRQTTSAEIAIINRSCNLKGSISTNQMKFCVAMDLLIN
jgi:hypothetical protein